MKKVISFVFLMHVFISPVHAGYCLLSINREACPGKESEAFTPYKGINPTFEKEFAADEAACVVKSQRSSKILRKKIIKKITVNPAFDGAALSIVSSESPCTSTKK